MNENYVSLSIDAGKCTACMVCELACSYTKEQIYSPSLSRIHVMQVHDEGINVPIACINCDDAPCIDSCPTEAIYREAETGIVRTDADICTGCGDCVDVCPYGAIVMPENQSLICDLCDGDPVCVSHCIYGAISYDRKPDTLLSSLHIESQTVDEARRWEIAKTITGHLRGGLEVRA